MGFVGVALAIWQGISAFFSFLGSAIWEAIRTVAIGVQYVGGRVAWVVSTTGSWFKDAFGGLSWLWTDVLRPAFTTMKTWFVDVHDALVRWFAPVVKILKGTLADITKIYQHWVQPVITVLDVTKKALGLLASVGVDWAKKLEDKITELENRIRAPFLLIVGKVNEIIGVIDRIVTFDGLYQRVMLFASLFAYKRSLVNFGINSVSRPLTHDELVAYGTQPETLTPQENAIEMVKFTRGEPVPFGPAAVEWADDLLLMIRGGARPI
jgi:hypothetical protein